MLFLLYFLVLLVHRSLVGSLDAAGLRCVEDARPAVPGE